MLEELDRKEWVFILTLIDEPSEEDELVAALERERNREFPMDDIRHALREGWISGENQSGTRVYWMVDEDEENTVPENIDIHQEETNSIERFLGDCNVESSRVQSCLEEAVEYYHSQITSIQRDWIDEQWGLPDEVIDELQIGWVDGTNNLIDHLRQEGYSDIEIARAGLATSNALKHVYRCYRDDCTHYDAPPSLTELRDARIDEEIDVADIDPESVVEHAVEKDWHQLYDWWHKRIVFTYPDENGDFRYLIARKTHASDDVQGKYLKLQVRPHTDNDAVFEPIYGVHNYERGNDLILTEGITDAIWAHYRGINCLAPVTKQFKQEHLDRLVDLAEDADRVFICNDAEETSNGLEAALRTADHLYEEGVDVWVGELPMGGDDEKVDLADYLRNNSRDTLYEEVLEESVRPSEHPMYDEAVTEENDTGVDRDYEDPETDGDRDSALFDLTIDQVVEQDSENGVRKGYRGDNPIKHVGQSHSDYFVYERYDGGVRARDFKSDHTYTPLTWLACAVGVRDTESPGGRFSDKEIYECWKYAKDQDMIPEDDPVPYRVLKWLAVREGLIDSETVSEDGLMAADYNAALTMVERDGYNPGRDRVGSQRDEKAAEAAVKEKESDDEKEQAINSLVNDMLTEE